MSEKDVSIILESILEEVYRIKRFLSNISDVSEFESNELVFYAVIKSLENIGEAVKLLPKETKEKYPLSWRNIAGMRDILVHRYFSIDTDIVWDVITNKLPEIELAVKTILESG